MAFSPWQILSPVQWAKWTWSAVRGGGAGEDEAGGPEGDPEEEDSQAETKSLSFRQVHASLPRCRRAAIHPSAAHSVCVCVVAHPRNHYHRNAASLPVTGSPLCIRKFRMFCPALPFPPFQCELSEPNPESAVFPHPGLLQSLSLKLRAPSPRPCTHKSVIDHTR